MTRLERDLAALRAAGWQITEEEIRQDGPDNTRLVGWRVTGCRNGVCISETAPYLTQARDALAARVAACQASFEEWKSGEWCPYNRIIDAFRAALEINE